MTTTQGFSGRVVTAFLLLSLREGARVSQEELARRVGKRAKKTYTQSAAKGWLRGVVPEDLDSQLALALELGVDPGWLYFFPHSAAPAPAGAEFTGPPGERAREADVASGAKKKRRGKTA